MALCGSLAIDVSCTSPSSKGGSRTHVQELFRSLMSLSGMKGCRKDGDAVRRGGKTALN